MLTPCPISFYSLVKARIVWHHSQDIISIPWLKKNTGNILWSTSKDNIEEGKDENAKSTENRWFNFIGKSTEILITTSIWVQKDERKHENWP